MALAEIETCFRGDLLRPQADELRGEDVREPVTPDALLPRTHVTGAEVVSAAMSLAVVRTRFATFELAELAMQAAPPSGTDSYSQAQIGPALLP